MKRNLFLTLILSMAVSTAYAEEEAWIAQARELAAKADPWSDTGSLHRSESHKPEGYTNYWYGTHTTGNWVVTTDKPGINDDGLLLSAEDAAASGIEPDKIGINSVINIGCYTGEAGTPASLAVDGEGVDVSTGNCLFVGGKGYTGDTGHSDFWAGVSPQEGFLTVQNGATLTVGTATTKALGAQLNVGQGESGVGHLLVDNGNVVSNAIMTVGSGIGSHGDVLVDNGGKVAVQATKAITTAGTALHIAEGKDSVGHVTVDNGSSLKVLGSLNDDQNGKAQTFIGQAENAKGDLTVKGASNVRLDGDTVLGYGVGSEGTINVEEGSITTLNGATFVGGSGKGTLNVDGSNTDVLATGTIYVSDVVGGSGDLNITNGATVTALGNVAVGKGGKGKVNNNGTLNGGTLVYGNGELHGAGTFGAAQVTGGGQVFVGDKATATQTYTGDLTLEDSTTTFSVADLTLPSAEAQTAWVSQDHSLIKMGEGAEFSITEATKFIIEFCGDALPSVSESTVDLGDFAILLVQGGVGSDVAALGDALLGNTTFTFSQGSLENPEDYFTATTIKGAHYLVANNNLYLVAGSIPEPATATLSLLALAALAARRRRK